MSRIKIDYGIDLGTTNSALAYIHEGQIEVKEIDRSKIVPSCVSYDRKGNPRVGISAYNKDGSHIEFKRQMGKEWKGKKNKELDETVDAEQLSAEVLKKLKAEITNEQFKSVVITVPAMFDISQVAATKRAGELAGFEQVETLLEPIAAAFAYGFKHKVQDGKYIVFDFGGGTFDAALVKSEGGVLSVVSSEGNNYLGGKDLDNIVVEEVLLPFLRDKFNITGLSEEGLTKLKNRLKSAAEQLKIELTKKDNVDILVDYDFGEDADGEEILIETPFSRHEVYGAMTPIFMKAIDLTKKLIIANNLKLSELTALVLVGGPTQIPAFRELIERELIKPDISLNPMTVVAEGAALYAATFNNRIEGHGALIGADTNEPTANVVELEIEYSATTVASEEPVGIKRKNTLKPYHVIINRSGGSWQSSKHELDDVVMVEIDTSRPNSFQIKLYDEKNNLVTCSPSQFTIIPGTSVDGGAPLPHHIGMEVYDAKKGMIFTPFRGLEKDKILPLTGVTDRELYTTCDIRPGVASDKMIVPVYVAERDAKNSRSIVNLFVDNIEINGMDVEKHVPENSLVEFTMKIDLSQNMMLEIDFPQLDMDVINKKMQFPRRVAVERKQIDNLFREADASLKRLESSTEKIGKLPDLQAQNSYYKGQLQNITDDNYEQIFGNLRSFLLELDRAEEEIKWPALKKDIIDELFDFEQAVNDCVEKKLTGWEKDQSDLQYFTKQKDQLFSMIRPDINMAEELRENIHAAMFELYVRHEGRELFKHYIEDSNNKFNSINWKNKSEAKLEVDRGMQMVRNNANKDDLRDQCRAIARLKVTSDFGPDSEGKLKT